MKKVLALVLCLMLVTASCTAMADWLDNFVDGVAEWTGSDKADVQDVVDETLDALSEFMLFGFSDNSAMLNRAAQSVFLLYMLDSATEITDSHIVGNGSGFLLFDNQTIVTNYHVVNGMSSLVAEADDGKQYLITEMIAGDPTLDIAIVRLPKAVDYRVLSYSTEKMSRGEKCVAIGSGLGIKNTITKGSISNEVSDSSGVKYFQHDAAINHGNSGGPLFNDAGKVIGVNCAFMDDGDHTAQNANLAIKISQVKDMYDAWNGTTVYNLPGNR